MDKRDHDKYVLTSGFVRKHCVSVGLAVEVNEYAPFPYRKVQIIIIKQSLRKQEKTGVNRKKQLSQNVTHCQSD